MMRSITGSDNTMISSICCGRLKTVQLEFIVEMQKAIQELLEGLPDERIREVLDFTRFIAQANDADEWRAFGQSQLARAYGEDEPEYSEADLMPPTTS
jgi:hypothetical protein